MRLKSDSQEVILGACLESCRPMRVRKVGASGTKGVGCGMGGRGREECRERICWRDCDRARRRWVVDCLLDRTIILSGELNKKAYTNAQLSQLR